MEGVSNRALCEQLQLNGMTDVDDRVLVALDEGTTGMVL